MVSTQRRNRSPVASGKDVATLDVPVYVHQDRITASREDGIETAVVTVIVAYSPRNKVWQVDCVDLTELNVIIPRTTRHHMNSPMVPVVTAILRALLSHNITPAEIRGWGRWFSAGDVSRARREVGC